MCAASAKNAVLAKARAIYGKRLTAVNYTELLACRSVNEIANYLKLKTNYSDAISEMSPGALHRRQLEAILRKKLYSHFAVLCRYERAVGDKFFEYYILRSDIEILLHAVRRLYLRRGDETFFNLPQFFLKEVGLDAEKIFDIQNAAELAERLDGTPYKALILPFVPKSADEQPDCFEIELAVMRYYYSRARELVCTCFSGAEKRELLEMLDFNVDIENIISMYRLKRLSGFSGERLHSCLVDNESLIPGKVIEKMLNAPTATEMLTYLAGSSYAEFADSKDEYPWITGKRLKYKKYSHSIRFSSTPASVMLSFIFLAQNEVDNLNHIIEGIRYSMVPEEISTLLIGTDS